MNTKSWTQFVKTVFIFAIVLIMAMLSAFSPQSVLAIQGATSAPEIPHDLQTRSESVTLTDNASNLPTDQIIIQYKTSAAARLRPAAADEMLRLGQTAGTPLAYRRAMSGDAHILRLPGKLPLDQVQVIATRLRTSPDIEYAEPDQIMRHTLDLAGIAPAPVFRPSLLTPNDPQYANQWYLLKIWWSGKRIRPAQIELFG